MRNHIPASLIVLAGVIMLMTAQTGFGAAPDASGPNDLRSLLRAAQQTGQGGGLVPERTTDLTAVIRALTETPRGLAAVSEVNSDNFTIDQQQAAEMLYIATADLDFDNNVDLIFSGSLYDQKLKVAYGNSSGGFDTPVTLLSGMSFAPVTVAYVNGDALPDIIVANSLGNAVSVLLNQGSRTFTTSASMPFAFSGSVPCITTGYFNNDSYLDMIVSPSAIIYYGDGQGAFPTSSSLGLAISGIAVGDFNKDGIDDFVAHIGDNAVVYLNQADGSFSPAGSTYVGGSTYGMNTAGGLADFDRDGNVDFAAVNYLGAIPDHTSQLIIGLGDGTGGFKSVWTSTIAGYALWTAVADVDRDNNLDVTTIATSMPRHLIVYHGDGAGNFPDSSVTSVDNAVCGGTWALASGDFDRDGNPDFVTGSMTRQSGGTLYPITIFYNDQPDAAVLSPEMTVTALSDPATNYANVPAVDFRVVNPGAFEIGREVSTVAGSNFVRLDADLSHTVDLRSVDRNLLNGEYRIVVRSGMGALSGGKFTMDVQVAGAKPVRIFQSYSPGSSVRATSESGDSLVFYYTVESSPSMNPPNGVQTQSPQPTFEWRKLVDADHSVRYHFQLSRSFDLTSPLYDDSTVINPQLRPASPLDVNSVYYWRVRSFDGSTWSPWTRTMAAYVGAACCLGSRGNVNTQGIVDLSDLTSLVSYLTGGGYMLPCDEAANVNGAGIVDLSDLTSLVSYLTGGGYALQSCP